jgi:hypothetical protein
MIGLFLRDRRCHQVAMMLLSFACVGFMSYRHKLKPALMAG